MFARKARRAWGLAERTNQPTTVQRADSELPLSRAMLAEAVLRSVVCRCSLARDGPFERRRRAPAVPGTSQDSKRPDVTSGPPRSRMRWSAHHTGTTVRGPTSARTTIDHDIVACVMARLTPGEPSLVRDGEEASRSSTALAETWRVRLGHIRRRLLGHGTGRGRRAAAFALATAERGVLAPGRRLAPSCGVNGYPHSPLRSSRRGVP